MTSTFAAAGMDRRPRAVPHPAPHVPEELISPEIPLARAFNDAFEAMGSGEVARPSSVY